MPEKKLDQVEPGAVKTLRDLVDKLDQIEHDYKDSADKHARRQKYVIGIGVVVAMLIGGLLFVAVQAKYTADRIASCTTAGYSCYEQNKKTGNELSKLIIYGGTYAIECARMFPDEKGDAFNAKLEACVNERLAKAVKANGGK